MTTEDETVREALEAYDRARGNVEDINRTAFRAALAVALRRAADIATAVKVECGPSCPTDSHIPCAHDEQANATVEALKAAAAMFGEAP